MPFTTAGAEISQPLLPAGQDASIWHRGPTFWLAVACLLTIVAYLPGLSGPFLLDDASNLDPLGAWLAGRTTWQHVVFGNTSGLFGRPLSMLSFMLDAALFGGGPLSFKITNLLIHLGCGTLIFLLCRGLFERDERLRTRAAWWALGIATIWLLHPIQASTVLYVVQRMAQLSAALVLIALMSYLRGRHLLESGHARAAVAWLFIAFPLATLAAALGKENGVLAPLFALILELAYFHGTRRPRAIDAFFLVFLLIPGVFVIGGYALHPEKILAGYQTRDFSFTQRVLTEPRVLLDYVKAILFPIGASPGLYGDDFPLSTGLLSPISTLLAIVFWIVVALYAWWLRRRNATFFAGVFLFLAGHVMESTVLPLEIYFEHRNYLPCIGLFMAVAGLSAMGYTHLRARENSQGTMRIAAVLLVLMLGISTHMRAWTWTSWPTIVLQAAASHPDSMRAQMDLAALFVKSGQPAQARTVFARLASSSSATARNIGAIYPVVLDCQIDGSVDSTHLDKLRAVAGNHLGNYEAGALSLLVQKLNSSSCNGLSNNDLAVLLSDFASKAPQNMSPAISTLHHMAADFFNRAGDLARARAEARIAWSNEGAGPSAGLLLAHLLTGAGEYAQAEQVLAEVRQRVPPGDSQTQTSLTAVATELQQARQRLDSGTRPQ
jgi:hypothetical protein